VFDAGEDNALKGRSVRIWMKSPVSHLYTHIPFCPKKCSYCAFVTHVGSLKLMEPYLRAVVGEAEQVAGRHAGIQPLDTVYFGGGTPSLMSPDQVAGVLTSFDRLFGLSGDCEISLEAHPSTVDEMRLRGFREAGINRISFGGESLDAQELIALGRAHSAGHVRAVVELARRAGFSNVNLDLMYGLPGQTLDSWKRTLKGMLEIGPDHVSLYPLSIEPKTVFARRWRERTLELPPDEAVAEMYHLASQVLAGGPYVHYEVSNWSRAGYECRHNLACWRNKEFYGLGVGAHGYLKPYRTENVRQTKRYIATVARGQSPVAHRELVDRNGELAETVMLGLRLLQEGVDVGAVSQRFGRDAGTRIRATARDLEALQLVHSENGHIRLQEAAVPMGNEIWQRFL
jgi:oxygen-independent coproporphyrinogen-3 oxidase